MPRIVSRVLFSVLAVIVILFLALAGYGFITIRRSFPETNAQVKAPGLDQPVEIYRDAYGIPHIYAATQHDLFFAQGYVHAQDRFWQMDFWRHLGSGRLSELLGDSLVETDSFLRTMGWARVAQEELDNLDENSHHILDAYAQGVNAYLEQRQGSALSLEYAVLKLNNPDYRVEPWTPLNSLTWVKAMAWDLGGNMDSEIRRAILLGSLSTEQVDSLFPPYPDDHPLIVPEMSAAGANQTSGSKAGDMLADTTPAFEAVADKSDRLQALLGPREWGIGSNNWVISGDLTATGLPLLANDPHLGEQMPSIWYEVGLHCQPTGPGCPFNVTGFSFAGDPGVIIGHNDRIGWGFTNVGPDVQDLYIERINPGNPNQYEVNGQWVDMDIVQETIQVAGGDPVDLTVRYTRHGPIVSDTYGPLDGFQDQAGLELPQNYALALKWTALEPSRTFQAIWRMNLASNWEEFRQAAQEFDVPAQNLVYADVDGNIGYQTPGKIPIRSGGDGTLPAPGWTDEYQWEGYIPFDELPRVFNPSKGYVATANNAVVGRDYPYLISSQWAYGYRAERIVNMIEAAPGPIDIAYLQKMQGDNKNLNAENLVPILLKLDGVPSELEDARAILEGWDYQNDMDSAPAALFAAFWDKLLENTFHDDLPEKYWPEGGSGWFEVVRHLVADPNSPWWDDRTTAGSVETRDDIFLQSFTVAVDELKSRLGEAPQDWTWGDLHGLTFHNPSLGESGVAPIESLFNRGPFRTAGGASIVNAASWNATESFEVVSLPSMRMILDFSDLTNSLTIHTTGQSGHAYHPHYVDMAELWRNIQYHPMNWSRGQVESASEAHLSLRP